MYRILTLAVLFFVASCQATQLMPTSREYSIQLKPELFEEGKKDASTIQLEEYLNTLLEKYDSKISHGFELDETRTTTYYDTQKCLLNKNLLILRQREKDGLSQPMLKFRTKDFLQTAYHQVTSTKVGKQKLEQDISLGFTNSISSSVKLDAGNYSFPNVGAVRESFSQDSLSSIDKNMVLYEVNEKGITEEIYETKKIKIAGQKLKLSLTFWYWGNTTNPDIVELSFKLKDEAGQYSAELIDTINDFYGALSGKSRWLLEKATSKTAFVYQKSALCN